MNKLTKLIFVMSALSLFSCSPKEKVDLVILNATAYTVDQDFSIVEAVAVKDGKIVALGSSSEISDRYSSSCIIDLDKKALYPGFIDAHCHFYSYGLGLLQRADLTGTESFEKVLEIMENHRHKFPSIHWLQGRGWDQNLWIDKTFPDKDKLNKLFPENPVILTRIDGHAALVNQKALELAGIDAATKISGGEVALKNGQPTGMLIDNAIGLGQ
jgi:predicted amidohydrolase YtcJ